MLLRPFSSAHRSILTSLRVRTRASLGGEAETPVGTTLRHGPQVQRPILSPIAEPKMWKTMKHVAFHAYNAIVSVL